MGIGDVTPKVHQEMAAALEWWLDEIARIQDGARFLSPPGGKVTRQPSAARSDGDHQKGRPAWPMLILRTPKGWTGPKIVDGEQSECTLHTDLCPDTDSNTH